MIRLLRVRDLALLASAEVTLGRGLNLLTGETGSGKSLIVDALGLSIGARASAEQVRHGADRAGVEALFDISGAPPAQAALREAGWDPEPELLLTREVGGRGSARINGRPATPGMLRRIGRELVALHGQHEQQALLDPDAQTALLDGFAGAGSARAEVGELHAVWTAARDRLAELERLQARGRREEEHLRWQLDELLQAGLSPGEDERLESERRVARHAARLGELTAEALAALRSDGGIPLVVARMRGAAQLDPRLEPLAARAEAVEQEAADLAAELRRYGDALDADPGRLEAVEARLALLQSLARKHGGSIATAIAERDRLASSLEATADLESALLEAGRAAEAALRALTGAASRLTRARSLGAADFVRRVTGELDGLRLEGARLEVRLVPRPEIGPEGAEQAEILFSANPGEPPAPLARVASGGELSRVMLAIKAAGPEAERVPTLVFDEVDAGIGGESARQVGLRLKRLGAGHQVLVVTHLAQIACFADHHLLVEKRPGPDGRSVVSVRRLDSADERASELARMMSGRITAKAVARAHELLQEAAQPG